MAINKKLIHFNEKSEFDKRLANNEILDTSIVFVKDSKEIWTHGNLYKSGNWSVLEEKLNIVEIEIPSGISVDTETVFSSEYLQDASKVSEFYITPKDPNFVVNENTYFCLIRLSSEGDGTLPTTIQNAQEQGVLFDPDSKKLDLTSFVEMANTLWPGAFIGAVFLTLTDKENYVWTTQETIQYFTLK